jgi:hypothetical protein
MATQDNNLQVINSMTQEKMDSLKDSEGKIPELANQLIITDEEDENVSYLRTEVIYDMYDAKKNWGDSNGINGNSSYSGKDFSKYDALIIHCKFALAVTGVGILDLTQLGNNTYRTNLAFGSEGTLDVYMCRVSVGADKTTFANELMGFTSGTTWNNRDNNASYYIYKIEGVLKEPAMIYTGAELHEGNGIGIKDGVISSKGFEFVGNYSATTTISIDIDLVNYDYFVFSSMEITAAGNMGFFFSQGLTWTTKRSGSDGSVDNTLSNRSYAYLKWGRAMSSVNYIRYDGTKTWIQSGDPTNTGFSYATGKPTRLTLSTDAGNIVQSYITLFRRKK